MNLFRSEEHARSWFGYDPAAKEGTMPLEHWVRVFNAPRYRHRLDPDYLLTKDTFRPNSDEVREQVIVELRGAGYWDRGDWERP